jgi:hypothetical protein
VAVVLNEPDEGSSQNPGRAYSEETPRAQRSATTAQSTAPDLCLSKSGVSEGVLTAIQLRGKVTNSIKSFSVLEIGDSER